MAPSITPTSRTPNAQKVQVQAAQTYPSTASAAAVANAAAAAGGHPGESAETAYRGCAIVSPQDGTELANVDALNVSVRTDPVVHAGDQIFILMDGSAVNGGNPTGTQFSISPGGPRLAHAAGGGARCLGQPHVPDPGQSRSTSTRTRS